MGRQAVQGHETAVFQQLEKLQAQDSVQSTKTTSAVLSAKPQTVANVEVSTQCSCPVENNQNPGLGEAQVAKLELDSALNQGSTDVLWLNKPITQASQVHLAVLLSMMSSIKYINATAFRVLYNCVSF